MDTQYKVNVDTLYNWHVSENIIHANLNPVPHTKCTFILNIFSMMLKIQVTRRAKPEYLFLRG